METYNLPKKKADAFASGAFLIALGILIYTGDWWPGILLAIWALLAVKQFFTGRLYDLASSTLILVGLFLLSFLNIHWSLLMPILFVIGGLYIIFREYFLAETEPEDDDLTLKKNGDKKNGNE